MKIKYLVQGEPVSLEELGGVDDGVLGVIGCSLLQMLSICTDQTIEGLTGSAVSYHKDH